MTEEQIAEVGQRQGTEKERKKTIKEMSWQKCHDILVNRLWQPESSYGLLVSDRCLGTKVSHSPRHLFGLKARSTEQAWRLRHLAVLAAERRTMGT